MSGDRRATGEASAANVDCPLAWAHNEVRYYAHTIDLAAVN